MPVVGARLNSVAAAQFACRWTKGWLKMKDLRFNIGEVSTTRQARLAGLVNHAPHSSPSLPTSQRTCGSSGRRALVGLVAILGVATAAVPSVSAAPAAPKPLRIAVFGDSLSVEARDYVTFIAGQTGVRVDFNVFGGTAPCDWYAAMRTAKASGRYNAVVTAWAGNQNTACSKGDTLVMYDQMLKVQKQIWGRTPLTVMMAPSPVVGAASETQVNTVRAVIAWTGNALGFKVYDPQSAFLNGGGVSSGTAPCVADEPCANIPDPLTGAPSNIVRQSDGLHFCPAPYENVPTGSGPSEGSTPLCNGFSPGAFRYAGAILAAANLAVGR